MSGIDNEWEGDFLTPRNGGEGDGMQTAGQGRCFLYVIPSHIFGGYWTTPAERDKAQTMYRQGQVSQIWTMAIEGNNEFGLLHPIHGIDTYCIKPDDIPEIDFSYRVRGVPYADLLFSVIFHRLGYLKDNRNVGKIQFRFLDDKVHQKLRDILEEAARKIPLPCNSQPLRTLSQVLVEGNPTKPI